VVIFSGEMKKTSFRKSRAKIGKIESPNLSFAAMGNFERGGISGD